MKRVSTVGPKSGSGPVGWGGDRFSQTRPISRSPDGGNNQGPPARKQYWFQSTAQLEDRTEETKRTSAEGVGDL